jgi:hypothetical protein
MTNQSARKVRLFIGGKDYAPCMMNFQGSDSHLDQSGLISFTGSLLLGKAIDFDESLDDRKSPTRFCRGVPIILECADSTNTLQRHPRGALRILSSRYDEEKQQLTLEVGDLIALLNFREPTDPDKADNKSCEGKPASAIITSLLNAAGIFSIAGTLPGTTYNYPLNLSGSYLQSVGKLLYANNCFGWINKFEVFTIQQANISSPPAGGITLNIGKDEIWYKRLDGAEAPCEKIKAVGSLHTSTEIPNPRIDLTERYGTASTVDVSLSNQRIIIQRTKRTEDWDDNGHTLTTTSEIETPAGLNFPILLGINTPKLQLVKTEIQTETLYFEKNSECKLKRKRTEIRKCKGEVLVAFAQAGGQFVLDTYFNTIFDLIPFKITEETWVYDSKDRPKELITETWENEIIIVSQSSDASTGYLVPSFELKQSARKVETWKQARPGNPGTWEYETISLQVLCRVKPETIEGVSTDNNKFNLIDDGEGSFQKSNSGQLIPQAPERCPLDCSTEQSNIEAFAYFSDPCASNLKQRERTFSVDFLAGVHQSASSGSGFSSSRETTVGFSQSASSGGTPAHGQLQAIAQREGRLLWGRYKGQEIAGTMSNIIFNYQPLMTIRAVEGDGTIQTYLIDGASWVCGQMKSLWSCDGIWTGTQRNGSVIPYWSESSFTGLGWGMGLQAEIFVPTDSTITWETVNWDVDDWEAL